MDLDKRVEISQYEKQNLLQRLPPFELSYEIFKHNTTPPQIREQDEWCFHIPVGPKWFVWFSFQGKKHGLFWLELNKNKKIQRVFFQEAIPPSSLDISAFYGSIFYGTQTVCHFVFEDVFYFRGNFVHSLSELEKWSLYPDFLQKHKQYGFTIPVINGNENMVSYSTHHIQLRHLVNTCPFVNWKIQNQQGFKNMSSLITNTIIDLKPVFKNLKKEQYKCDTVFSVQADTSDDIYKLYVFGPNRKLLFYDFSLIPDYETSKKMNKIFRKVRENDNIDLIEESDDEEETTVLNEEKHYLLVCRFHQKFKKWVPLHLANSGSRVVHICQL